MKNNENLENCEMVQVENADEGMNEGLSWDEIKDICKELNQLYTSTTEDDVMKIRSIIAKRNEMFNKWSSECELTKKKIQGLINENENIASLEISDSKNKEIDSVLTNLKKDKADVSNEIENINLQKKDEILKLRSEFQSIKEYEQKDLSDHAYDIPRIRYAMSLYASLTGIKWDYSSDNAPRGCKIFPKFDSVPRLILVVDIAVPGKKTVKPFKIDNVASSYETANQLWDLIDEAFN